ncbi:MAG TPA: PDZ domain-containing protein [Bryobacterales bacterium]|nr:PDZ domain-containing protein [Bryobacterales bacterium]
MESRSPAYVAVLALIAGSILMVGSLMKPKRDDPEPRTSTLPRQEVFSPLSILTQRGSLEDMAAYFSRLASDASRHLIFLEDPPQTGVVWDAAGTLITSNTRRGFPNEVRAGTSGDVDLMLEVSGPPPPEAPVVALSPRSGYPSNPAPRLRTTFLKHGEWLVITWLSSPLERSFAPGLYLGSRPVECGGRPVIEVSLSVTPAADMAGGGVFDFDGSLIGLVAHCDGLYLVLVPESVDEILAWTKSFEGRLLERYGLRISLLTEREREHFGGEETVVVREVWQGRLAEQEGVRPGDLIAAFDERPVNTPDDLHPLVLPAAREVLALKLRRGRRMITASLPAQGHGDVNTAQNASAGLVLASEPDGFLVESVVDNSTAARAGIRSGDRLLTVDGTSVRSAAQARAVLEGRNGQGRFVVVRRGARLWGALLQP